MNNRKEKLVKIIRSFTLHGKLKAAQKYKLELKKITDAEEAREETKKFNADRKKKLIKKYR